MRDDVAFHVDFERAAPRYRQLPPPVQRILKLCDGTRGLTQVVALSPIDAERTEAVLRRLAQLGIILPRPKVAPGTTPATTPATTIDAAPRPATDGAPAAAKAAKEAGEHDARPSAQVLAFTKDEEQFFDSPIDHLVTDEFAD
jgi:hypothetical protein